MNDGRTRISEAARRAPGGAQSPLQISARGWRATLRRTLTEIKADRITITAAGVAFYWFLSVFPLLFAAVALLALTDATPELIASVNDTINDVAPGDAAAILTGAVSSAESRAAVGGSAAPALIAIAIALWSASSGMAATPVGLDVAYDVEEDRTFLKRRLMGIVLLLAAFVLGGVAVGLVVFGTPIADAVQRNVPAGRVVEWLWTLGRWLVSLLAVTTLLALFYYVGPNRKPPNWKWISPGGVVATILWFLASLGFSLYLSRFGGSYAENYGALAGVAILLLWMYLTALATLVGAELNGELERQRTMRVSSEP